MDSFHMAKKELSAFRVRVMKGHHHFVQLSIGNE
jgi:hypothetical protein